MYGGRLEVRLVARQDPCDGSIGVDPHTTTACAVSATDSTEVSHRSSQPIDFPQCSREGRAVKGGALPPLVSSIGRSIQIEPTSEKTATGRSNQTRETPGNPGRREDQNRQPHSPNPGTKTAGPGKPTHEPPRFWRSVAKPGFSGTSHSACAWYLEIVGGKRQKDLYADPPRKSWGKQDSLAIGTSKEAR
ncbi:hypothetical protein NDU88_011721 [Pleurodeles waltl]|uniref:Uncharacterized protein n=1 Tax=Pleurodeles waltl TaxID=8319 RepID=A0AAV7S202_PLEWA|nr:hypothetical protein NDU88_011721 [Pleurodeles waltl]